ncbi:MAG TPA: ABC transporter permease [Parafilimonas sp.]|nr:ABC transporter permease [Parafilimonas sp.]
MLKNYIKTALRHFWKNRSFSFINIIGLGLSMAVCLLLIMLINDANDYDHFHPDSNRVYRINTEALRKGGGSEPYASSPYVVGATLASNFAGIETWTMFNSGTRADISAGEKKFNLKMNFTNASFFNLFGFTFKEGFASTALNEPNTIVLTKELSDKLFPDENAVGKTVDISGMGLFRVTGVLNKFPGKTHFEFDALGSFATIPALEKNNSVTATTNNWLNYYTNYTYIRIKPGVKASQIEGSLAEITKKNYKGLALETRDAGYRFYLQPLNDITPGPLLSNSMGRGLSSTVLWFLSILAFIIILSAAFNYTNLTIAKAMSRMKEIALRKVVGSSRGHIFLQIILESVITALFALFAAFAILQFLIPQFSGLGFINEANISFHTNTKIILLFVAFAVLAGVVAGVLPAMVLSRVKPLMLMQRLQNLKLFRHLGLRKALLVIQFMISIIFISMVTVTYRQLSYAVNINFGTHQTHIFNIPLQGMDYAKAEQEFSKIPGVERISAISNLMGNYSDMGDDIRVNKDKDPVTVRQYFTDENYISNMQLRLIAGKNFPANHAQQHEQFAIVNETFVKQFQLGSPMDAVGKTIIAGDSTMLTIHGVVKDFLFKPADYAIAPMLMRYDPKNWSILNCSIASGNTIQTTSQLEAAWKKLDPYHTFEGRFYSEEVESIFSDMRDVIWMVAFLSILGIVIACLGLLGITLFTVQSKVKEISIRKVIGASPAALMKLLLRSYLQVMIIAVCLAIPVAVFLSNMLLQEMSQRITLNVGLFIPGVTVIVLLSLITIGSQTLKAVLVNPVKGLRME